MRTRSLIAAGLAMLLTVVAAHPAAEAAVKKRKPPARKKPPRRQPAAKRGPARPGAATPKAPTVQPPARPPVPLAFTKWVEPNFRAFEAEVPKGWTVQGGTVRGGLVDWRHGTTLESPDGGIQVRTGDTKLRPFYDGPSFGPVYTPQPGQSFVVAPYVGGRQFAEDYVQSTLSRCSDVVIDDTNGRPDLVAGIQLAAPQAPGGSRFDGGEVFYTCRENGATLRGYAVAVTYYAIGSPGGPKIWVVWTLYGVRARESQFAQGLEVLKRFDRTFKYGDAWLRRTGQNVAQVTSEENARQKSMFELLDRLTPVWTGVGGRG